MHFLVKALGRVQPVSIWSRRVVFGLGLADSSSFLSGMINDVSLVVRIAAKVEDPYLLFFPPSFPSQSSLIHATLLFIQDKVA